MFVRLAIPSKVEHSSDAKFFVNVHLWQTSMSATPISQKYIFAASVTPLFEVRSTVYKFSGANADREMGIFPVQLTTCRIGNLNWLIHILAICVTIHILPNVVLSPASTRRTPLPDGSEVHYRLTSLVLCFYTSLVV